MGQISCHMRFTKISKDTHRYVYDMMREARVITPRASESRMTINGIPLRQLSNFCENRA